MNPEFFKTKKNLRKWFEKNHHKLSEQWIGFYKTSSGKESITWSESIDEDSYMIRFTPRKSGSNWSAVNIKKIEELTKLGLMKPEGIEAYKKKKDSNSKIYTYEQNEIILDKKYEALIKANKKAWKYFDEQLAPSYKKVSIKWVMSAKQETTRLSRLKILIESSAKGEKIPGFVKYKK